MAQWTFRDQPTIALRIRKHYVVHAPSVSHHTSTDREFYNLSAQGNTCLISETRQHIEQTNSVGI